MDALWPELDAATLALIDDDALCVVNKADLPGVDTVLQSLRFLFSLGGPRRGKPVPPIDSNSAQQNEGIGQQGVLDVDGFGGKVPRFDSLVAQEFGDL